MDHLQKLIHQSKQYLFIVFIINNLILLAGIAALNSLGLSLLWALTAISLLAVLLALALSRAGINFLMGPLQSIRQAILHVAPEHSVTPAPNLETIGFGRELVTSLALQVYQMASSQGNIASNSNQTGDLRFDPVAKKLPLPLFIMDDAQNVIFANETALTYLNKSGEEVIGKNIYSVLDMSFTSENTFDSWLARVRTNSVTAHAAWDHVRIKRPDNQPALQFDLAAYYSKPEGHGVETMLVLFDQSNRYEQEDKAISFVSLAVHELRTPLTVMRGYIEVLEDELMDQVSPELQGFIHKMNASAQQLTTFVSKILNVARVEADQLYLQLSEENWADIVTGTIDDLALRAQVNGRQIKYEIQGGLPTVGVDRVGISEVLTNLLENAIKYSADSQTILVRSSLTKDGLIETSVQDFGVGLPGNMVQHLFEKYYRDPHNRSAVSGSGLGLYLCRAIIRAHNGNIWVNSKEGQGSTFSFTVLPYAKLADEQKNSNNNGIVHGAHGWIKNHSMYRR